MQAAAGKATATYGLFIVINTVGLSLRNLTTLHFKADAHRDMESKVSHELELQLFKIRTLIKKKQ